MKKLLTATIMTLILATAFSAEAKLESALQNICKIVENDDKSSLVKKLRTAKQDYNSSLRDFYKGVTCNGDSLIRHAEKNESFKTGKFMIRRLSKSMAKNELNGFSETDYLYPFLKDRSE